MHVVTKQELSCKHDPSGLFSPVESVKVFHPHPSSQKGEADEAPTVTAMNQNCCTCIQDPRVLQPKQCHSQTVIVIVPLVSIFPCLGHKSTHSH